MQKNHQKRRSLIEKSMLPKLRAKAIKNNGFATPAPVAHREHYNKNIKPTNTAPGATTCSRGAKLRNTTLKTSILLPSSQCSQLYIIGKCGIYRGFYIETPYNRKRRSAEEQIFTEVAA